MIQVTSSITQFRGSHYDFGLFQANQIKRSTYMIKRSTMNQQLFKRFKIDIHYISSLYHQFAPFILEEIKGLADGLELSQHEAFMHFAGFFANRPSGCSIMMNEDYMVRNYDQEPSTYDGRFCLFQPSDGGYASVGPTMMITGRTDGINEHGLSIGYNFVNSRANEDGFVCNMLARIVLETCKSIDEAIELLKEIPHKHSFNYCLLDITGKTIVVEATPRNVTVRESLVCTNHFHKLTSENRYTMADSLRREKVLFEFLQGEKNWQHAYALLNNIEEKIYATKYSAWDGTIHTAIYHPKELIAMISFGFNRKPLPIHFGKWLNGTDIPITKIKGELDAKVGFVF